MNKLDRILGALLREGRINVGEALAIGAAVRRVACGLPDNIMREHSEMYGRLSVSSAASLLEKETHAPAA